MAGTSIGETEEESVEPVTVGEDSAAFDLGQQKISSWIYFGGILGVVLFLLDVVWIDNSTGFSKDFIAAVSGVSESHEVNNITVLIILDNSERKRIECLWLASVLLLRKLGKTKEIEFEI